MDSAVIAALVGVGAALIGYFVKHQSDIRLAQRDARLERINRQLSEFYGPLLALTRAAEEAWLAFRRRYRTGGGSYWKSDPPPTMEDAIVWRLWMSAVFVPLHEQMMELVLDHGDLIEEPEMPPSLLILCAHIAGYQAVLKDWEQGEISLKREDNISVVNFPGHELAEYAAAAFARLKAEQAELLGASAPRRRSRPRAAPGRRAPAARKGVTPRARS